MSLGFKKQFVLGLGFASVGLGFLGMFLPILPTTPFMLMAAYCFSRSSDKWHDWLLATPYIGHAIRSWDDHRVIGLPAKLLATVMIVLSIGFTVVFVDFHWLLKSILIIVAALVLNYIWRQRSQSIGAIQNKTRCPRRLDS